MTFPSYPEYQEAGVEWLGDVPEHWRSVPIKYMALERGSLFLDGDWIESKDISSEGIRYITTGNVGEGSYKEQGAGFISEETFHFLGCTDVYEGDVLISRLNNPIGRACVAPDLGGRVVTSVDNVIFRPDSRFHKKFIVYLFSSDEYFRHTGNLARGATMQRISRGLLGNIRVVTPSFEEQAQIARFLDHETARIDALIEEQQRLIELLKEKRHAVISFSVTKGLDPTAPMKDSGVEWLGEVPTHWTVTRIKRLAKVISKGTTPTTIGEDFQDEGVRFLKAENIFAGCVLPEPEFFINERAHISLARSSLAEKDILVVIAGATTGKSAVLSGEFLPANTNQAVSFIRLLDTGFSEFIQCWLSTDMVQRSISLNSVQSAQPNLSMEDLGEIPVPLPPPQELEFIVNYIASKTSIFDALISKAESASKLLGERRSALISAAVTGKVDVRGWKPPVSTLSRELEEEAV